MFRYGVAIALALGLLAVMWQPGNVAAGKETRLLYVASPGVRNYVEYGGVGVLVYDIDLDAVAAALAARLLDGRALRVPGDG